MSETNRLPGNIDLNSEGDITVGQDLVGRDKITYNVYTSPQMAQADAGRQRSAVLWVDDFPDNNAPLIEYIQKAGFEVVTALTTAEAIAKFSEQDFDRVVSDMRRTEYGRQVETAGLELTKQIRTRNNHIPIFIFTTAQSLEAYRDAAISAGVTDMTDLPVALLHMLQLHFGRDAE
jgi:CheY-like chemotaxis protein